MQLVVLFHDPLVLLLEWLLLYAKGSKRCDCTYILPFRPHLLFQVVIDLLELVESFGSFEHVVQQLLRQSS